MPGTDPGFDALSERLARTRKAERARMFGKDCLKWMKSRVSRMGSSG
jgi:hypothetical protein